MRSSANQQYASCAFAILLAFTSILGSCRRPHSNGNEAQTQRDLTESESISAEDSAVTVTLESLQAKDFAANDQIDEWSVEVFNSAAAAQLKRLQNLIEGKRFDEEGANALTTVDFRCQRLAQANVLAFQEGSLAVYRRKASAEPESTSQFRGRSGFADAWSELDKAIPSPRRAKFKVTHVTNKQENVDTKIHVEIVSESGNAVIQQTATWRCGWNASAGKAPLIRSIQVEDEEIARIARKTFTNATEVVMSSSPSFHRQLAHGVDHWMDRIEQRFGINSSGWQGLAVGDANGDGRDDVYVCQPGGLPNLLFQQKPDGTVEDVSASSGVDWWDHSHAALFLDLDSDADQDLVVATALGLIFMSNDGHGNFAVETAKLCPEAMPFTLAAADYDNDGDLDVYASCYSPRGNAIATQFLARPVPYHDANNGGRNCLFRNDGQWKFTNATKTAGLDQNNRRFSLAAAWEDYDNDGDQDLYVANDYGRNNLYRNDNGKFQDVAAEAGVEDISAGMSVSWADFNHDGQADLYVSNMWSSAGNRITYQRQFQSNADERTRSEFQRHARGNSLFMNTGDGRFQDVSLDANVSMGRWAWGSKFVDINNDSFEDLIVANGFITQESDSDL